MKRFLMSAVLFMVVCSSALAEKIAVQIIYDGSGSMAGTVSSENGYIKKSEAAINAGLNLVNQIDAFVKNNESIDIEIGLIIFNGGEVKQTLPLTKYNRTNMLKAIRDLPKPHGGTPIGEAMQLAYKTLPTDAKSHIFVLTDGEENGDVKMADVIASEKNRSGVYFVAFDVNASEFDSAKQQGAMIVQANSEKELFAKVQTVFATKILLEKEE